MLFAELLPLLPPPPVRERKDELPSPSLNGALETLPELVSYHLALLVGTLCVEGAKLTFAPLPVFLLLGCAV